MKTFKKSSTKLNLKEVFRLNYSLVVLLVVFSSTTLYAQDFTQTIKGRIIDQQTQMPLPGATIAIMNTNPPKGTITDPDGYFKIENVITGRVSLQVSFMGYHPVTLSNLNLSTGKELVLTIEMEEQVIKTEEIIVKAKKNKAEVNNEMATISARTFTIEESQRFAGARNDVARMASNFAGVSTSNDASNDIVIRGNSPNGLLWRLEGIEIPNPNHFGGMGATGGPVSMLNNNVLSNSDFMTSAFPAEYGNALSGVFDLKMRNGNYEKHEFIGQVGFNGFEVGAEGPLSKNSRASYMVNARYSTLEVMSAMGMDFGTGTAIPKYKDVTFKVHIPTSKLGVFNIFGLGGINSIDFVNSEKDEEDSESLYEERHFDIYAKNDMAVVGANHTYFINDDTYTKLTLSGSRISNHTVVDSIALDKSTIDLLREHYVNYDYTANFYVNKKFNSKHNLRLGAEAMQRNFKYIDSILVFEEDRFRNRYDENDNAMMYRYYAQWQYKPIDKLVFNAGMHVQQMSLSNNFSYEPRLGLKWYLAHNQSINLGFGIHSKPAATYIFFKKSELEPGVYSQPNLELDFIKSRHYVVGYDWSINPSLRVKLESYYQDIYQSIVEDGSSEFSLLNATTFSWQLPDSLKNGGSGRNYGVELTLEKFLDKGFYFLLTTSIFDSKYKGSDDKLRSTAFDSKYVVNFLGGNEFEIFRKPEAKYRKWLTFDGKVTVAGGQRYTPINIDESRANNTTEYYNNLAFSKQFKDYFRADLRIAFKLEGKKTCQEWAIDVQNLSNSQNALYKEYDSDKDEIKTVYQLGLFPMVQYRITF